MKTVQTNPANVLASRKALFMATSHNFIVETFSNDLIQLPLDVGDERK